MPFKLIVRSNIKPRSGRWKVMIARCLTCLYTPTNRVRDSGRATGPEVYTNCDQDVIRMQGIRRPFVQYGTNHGGKEFRLRRKTFSMYCRDAAEFAMRQASSGLKLHKSQIMTSRSREERDSWRNVSHPSVVHDLEAGKRPGMELKRLPSMLLMRSHVASI